MSRRSGSKSSPVAIGDVIDGKYRVDGVLGEGGMGVVLAVQHLELGEPFAVKVLTGRTDAVLRQRFLREARAAAQLDSEHVVKVFDVGSLPHGEPYMVMERLEGCDLDALVGVAGPRPVTEAVEHVLDACAALEAAHARGMVHRDIKPANLFLSRRAGSRPTVKVVDFGVTTAGVSDGGAQLTDAGQILGSPEYMAPEQLVSSRDVDARADVWSLGATLFDLLSGEVPFAGATMQEVFAKVVREPPRSLRTFAPGVPPELERVVERCLAKDPDERFASVADLAAALQPFAATREPPVAVVPTRASPTWPMVPPHSAQTPVVTEVSAPQLPAPRPSRRWAIVLAAAIALGGVAAAIVVFAQPEPVVAPAQKPSREADEPKPARSAIPDLRQAPALAGDLLLDPAQREEIHRLLDGAEAKLAAGDDAGAIAEADRALAVLFTRVVKERDRSLLAAEATYVKAEAHKQLALVDAKESHTNLNYTEATKLFYETSRWAPGGAYCPFASMIELHLAVADAMQARHKVSADELRSGLKQQADTLAQPSVMADAGCRERLLALRDGIP